MPLGVASNAGAAPGERRPLVLIPLIRRARDGGVVPSLATSAAVSLGVLVTDVVTVPRAVLIHLLRVIVLYCAASAQAWRTTSIAWRAVTCNFIWCPSARIH